MASSKQKMNNLRPRGRFTRDLFSRAGRASARKYLIFLYLSLTVLPATSDNVQSVNFRPAAGRSAGERSR